MASHTKRDGQIPSRFVYIHTLLPSPYRTSRRIYNFCTKVLAVIAIMVIFDLNRTQEAKVIIPATRNLELVSMLPMPVSLHALCKVTANGLQ